MYTARNLEDAFAAPEETTELLLAGHGFSDFPMEILELPNVQKLDLSQNLLRSLPPALFRLPKLKALNLHANQLRQLPEEVAECLGLQRLDLSLNQLAELPLGLAQLQELSELKLGQNGFSEFPLRAMPPNLEALTLAHNQLQSVPPLIRHLHQLRYLDLRHNALRQLQPALIYLEALEHLLLEGNPLRICIDERDPELVLMQFFALQKKHARNKGEALAWLGILQGDLQLAQHQPKDILLQSLNAPIPSIRMAASAHLPLLFPAKLPAPGSQNLFWAGKFRQFKKNEAQKLLEQAGHQFQRKLEASSITVILGEQPGPMLSKILAQGHAILLEQQVKDALEQLQGSFLKAVAAQNPLTDNLRKLIRSHRPENIEMALVMMEKAGTPPGLLSDLLALGIFHPQPEIAEKGMEAFQQLAKGTLSSFVKRQIQQYIPKEGPWESKPLLQALARNPELDIETLVEQAIALHGEPLSLLTLLPESARLPHFRKATREGQLMLGGLGLGSFPSALEAIPDLKYLLLGRNQIAQLPLDWEHLKGLEILDLSDNQIDQLPEGIGALQKLQGLDLAGNLLRFIPESIGKLNQLEAIRLDRNKLQSLPDSLRQLPRLEAIGCYGCKFGDMPAVLPQLSRLKSLDLGDCQLKALPTAMPQFLDLENFAIRDNPISHLPEWLGRLSQLRHLDLSLLDCRQLPESLKAHPHLERIYLIKEDSWDWEQVIPILQSMPRLRFLYLRGKKITRKMQLYIEEKLPQMRIMWNG